MRVSECVQCKAFPCSDVKRDCYFVPRIDLKPETISIAMISEAAAPEGDYYACGDGLFQRTTVEALQEAGVNAPSMADIVRRGVYVTTAVKCGKTGYAIKSDSIRECSRLLEKELSVFPNLKVIMLMGDVAIKALNAIARSAGEERVIPAGSTYKLRGREYFFRGMRVFPSYLQAGPSILIEKGKRKVIAEDIQAAMALVA